MAILTLGLVDLEAGAFHEGAAAGRWADVAARAHAILSQTLPDETLDDISTSHAAHPMPFEFPPFLIG